VMMTLKQEEAWTGIVLSFVITFMNF